MGKVSAVLVAVCLALPAFVAVFGTAIDFKLIYWVWLATAAVILYEVFFGQIVPKYRQWKRHRNR